jgi:hypothetical protein
MPKDLTVKDVLYALEYLDDALMRTPISDGRARWHMRSGATVKETVANAVRASGHVRSFDDCGRQTITWKAAA